MPEIDEAFCSHLRSQLCGIYQTADRLGEYILRSEINSRGLYAEKRLSVVDVRVEPSETQVFVYYTIVEDGKIRCREKLPMLWEKFLQVSEQESFRDAVKNPFTMETTVFCPYPEYPPTRKVGMRVREVAPEEACEILAKQARTLNDDGYYHPHK